MLNSFYNKKYNVSVAAELFSCSWCNLDCVYCYIPKGNQTIKDKHKKIIEEIKEVTPVIDRFKKLYGDSIKVISHWGSEPSLTIKYFDKFYERALEEFPKLNRVSMSSNFLSNTDDLVNFINNFPKERKFSFDIQLSLDGPPWITDKNRRGGSTQKIVENMVKFVDGIDTVHKVETHFKPTVSREDYPKLLEGNNALNYYAFFDHVLMELMVANRENKVNIKRGCDPTVICPDAYTQQDGINFNMLYEKTQKIRKENKFKYVIPDSNYWHAFRRLMLIHDEFYTKHKMFTCSAGDSQFGISEYLHPCHDTFYLPYPSIQDDMLRDTDRICSKQEDNSIKTGKIDSTVKWLTLPVSEITEKDLIRYIYTLRGFHDFPKHKMNSGVGIIKEMAHCGQVSECYKNDEMAALLSMFALTRHSCPTGNAQENGSINVGTHTYYRLFGNGLVENFVRRWYNEE